MPITPKDPLLSAGRILSLIFMGLLALIAAAMPVIILLALLNQRAVAAELGIDAAALGALLPAIVILLAGFCAFGVAGFQFFRQLRRIIATVGEGDPFTPANSDRLRQMGWLVVGAEIVALVLSGFAEYVQNHFPSEDLNFDVDASLEGVLLAVLLFILARVFRHGAAMREDLEGTV